MIPTLSSDPAARDQSAPPALPPNARHAWGGIWRLTKRRFSSPGYWLWTLGSLALLAFWGFSAVPAHPASDRFPEWVTGFYLRFLVPILAFISMAGALRDDLKPGVGDYLFTRPLRRPVYVAFRYLAQMACAQIDFLLAFAVVATLGISRQAPGVMAMLPLLLFGQMLLVAGFGALGLLCGVVTSRYLLVGLVYGAVVEIGLGSIATPLNQLAISRQVASMLEAFLQRAAAHQPLALFSASAPWMTAALLAAATAGILAVAALLFSRQEHAGNPAKD